MTKDHIARAVALTVKNGNWMLRRSNGGEACHNGFAWKPIDQWTEAPDWTPADECGGGLHGNDGQTTGCFWSNGNDLDFCEYDPADMVRIGGSGGKIKVRRARVLLRNELPEGLHVGGSLYLSGTGITELPKTAKIGRVIGL